MAPVIELGIDPERITAVLPALKVAFWLLSVLLILVVLRRSLRGKQQKAIGRAYRIFFVVIALLFTGILAYQATWQLAGFSRPEFVEFMKRYNRRPDNPASRMVRGRILTADGVELAVRDPLRPGQRGYPAGPAFSHLVGYDHPIYGLAGLEAADDALLSGVTRDTGPEWEQFKNNILKREEIRGFDLVLTLRADLQREAHRLMDGRRGAVVFLDPSTGALLVLYSSPGFDPEDLQPALFARKDPSSRLLNRALQGLYPAGSTFKLLTAAAALESGLDPVIDCPADGFKAGSGSKPIRDHEYYEYQKRGQVWKGHGRLSMRDALAKSSNVYFARLGVQVGGEKLHAAVVRYGLTRSWIVHEGSSDRIASAAGRFPPLSDRDVAKTAQVSIGQGDMLVTPLHMALLAGAIGRRGVVWKPHLTASAELKPIETLFRPETSKALAAMMRHAVTQGTGRGADIPGLNVAGKTGTAQNPHGADHAWFVGFAPSVNPRIAFAVLVEQGGFGSEAAVPIAAGVLRKALSAGLLTDASAGKGTP